MKVFRVFLRGVLCGIGFHKWKYTFEGHGRWCECCPSKQEQVFGIGVHGEWADCFDDSPEWREANLDGRED